MNTSGDPIDLVKVPVKAERRLCREIAACLPCKLLLVWLSARFLEGGGGIFYDNIIESENRYPFSSAWYIAYINKYCFGEMLLLFLCVQK